MHRRDCKQRRYSRMRATVSVILLFLFARIVLADTVEVKIDGLEEPLLTNVRKSLSVAAEHEEPWPPDQIQRLYRLSPREIRQALQPYGYYNPTVDKSLIAPEGDNKAWMARFKIEPGPATEVAQLKLAAQGPGDQIPAVQQALENTQLAEDKRLVQSDYSATKSALYNAAYNAGYLDARFSQSAIRVDPENNTATIELVLDTGERYYFGPVTFAQDLLKDSFVQRFVPFSIGQPFDAEELVNLQLALSNTDYYSQVAISAPRQDAFRGSAADQWFYDLLYPPPDPLESIAELQVPVTVKAEPSKPQHYTVSAGYGTDTGPRLGLGVKFRHLNQSGHQFSTDLRISQVERTLHSSYDIPIGDVATDKLSFTGTISNQEYGDITSNLFGVGAVRDTGWTLGRKRAYINLEREYYDLGDGSRSSTLLYPGYNISLQKADSLLFTRKGVSASLDVRGASSALLSETDFFRTYVDGHAVVPVTRTVRLVMRAELGAITADDFRAVPPSQRFFAGGQSSVRGYSYQSISPVNEDNDDIGGQYLATASVEANYFFYKKFGLAAFFDAGDVANNANDFKLKKGAGIGFRWGSPVGMVRLDLAYPFDESESSFFIGFSLGPDL